MNYDSIIFDLDGTLWNAIKPITYSWNKVLKERFTNIKKQITEQELLEKMGLQIQEIISDLIPEMSENEKKEFEKIITEEENNYLSNVGGTLYNDLKETLAKLTKTHKLYIVSNCQKGYIESFLKAHNLEKFFKDKECIGNTGLQKAENIKLVIERNNLKKAIYVGDTDGDSKSAKQAGIPFVFAEYGFGNTNQYDYKINSFKELLQI